ncbi:hypothetical protein LWI29_003960 [Acer saccharum]|uniref:Uncharacterized protein n=1 Tax=Acer saccharum TaxID=4024 RepID=A0AA39V8C1_ACESA|nr:hypothetical protein LWI29_003960 [Acer saccharum]
MSRYQGDCLRILSEEFLSSGSVLFCKNLMIKVIHVSGSDPYFGMITLVDGFTITLASGSQKIVMVLDNFISEREKGIEVHKVETYNIYGCTYALLIFAFEVIPDLAIEDCGTRREIELSPRILKWDLSQRPRGDKLDSIFIERMFARVKLVPTPVELAERSLTTRRRRASRGP